MPRYSERITLTQSKRGVWGLDPFKGCDYGMANNENGCYGVCYAARIAKSKGFDFSGLVYRKFDGYWHKREILKEIKRLIFIRLGIMCDPSSDWGHTIDIINEIRPYQDKIVIITKHWTALTDNQKAYLGGIVVNTSISALDSDDLIEYRLAQYQDLKKYCSSILRVNSCDFIDAKLKARQDALLNNEDVINNVLRLNKSHHLVTGGKVNIYKADFLGSNSYPSLNNDVYFGDCYRCPDKCGIKEVNTKYEQFSLTFN